ncbi:nuclear transport factor 2 family protein [Planomicrobium sp. CPCC 101110]|nr:nuclear transport factor 2 family protein [Planomicrobium sp. CPCC 101110]
MLLLFIVLLRTLHIKTMLKRKFDRFTFCLKKINESWLITHEHSSLPIDIQSGKGIFNLK